MGAGQKLIVFCHSDIVLVREQFIKIYSRGAANTNITKITALVSSVESGAVHDFSPVQLDR